MEGVNSVEFSPQIRVLAFSLRLWRDRMEVGPTMWTEMAASAGDFLNLTVLFLEETPRKLADVTVTA